MRKQNTMSSRIEGERVYCYQCQNEWDRAHGGLQCPRCNSEFVEIVPPGGRTDVDDVPEPSPEPLRSPQSNPHEDLRSLREHYPWRHDPDRNPAWQDAPDPDEGDIRTIHFNSGGGGNSMFSFSRTYTTGFQRQQTYDGGAGDPAANAVMRDFEGLVNNLLGGHGGMRTGNFGGSMTINGHTTTFGAGTHDADFPMMPSP